MKPTHIGEQTNTKQTDRSVGEGGGTNLTHDRTVVQKEHQPGACCCRTHHAEVRARQGVLAPAVLGYVSD